MKGEVKDSALTEADVLEAENLWIIDAQDQVKSDPKFKHWKAQLVLKIISSGFTLTPVNIRP